MPTPRVAVNDARQTLECAQQTLATTLPVPA